MGLRQNDLEFTIDNIFEIYKNFEEGNYCKIYPNNFK